MNQEEVRKIWHLQEKLKQRGNKANRTYYFRSGWCAEEAFTTALLGLTEDEAAECLVAVSQQGKPAHRHS